MSRGVKDMGLANKIGNKVEPAHMKHYGQEQRSIIRQSSLKSAVLLVEAIIPRLQTDFSVKDLTDLTLETAEKFEEWVLR
jgi:uncharacterized lipoprotein YddW (UPF0748 family)